MHERRVDRVSDSPFLTVPEVAALQRVPLTAVRMDTPLGDDAPPWFTGGRVPGRVWSKACGNP